MIVNNKVIENIGLEDIENIIKDAIGCNDDSISFTDLKLILDINMQLQETINNYRDERVQKFASENEDKYNIIFHAIPIDAFSKSRINFKKARNTFHNKQFLMGFNYSDFEGLYSNVNGHSFKMRLFRNGIFEAIAEHDYADVHVDYSKNRFEEFVSECLEVYDELNISCPIIFFVTFTNVKDRKMAVNEISFNQRCTERDILDPTGVLIKNKNQVESEVHNIFVPIFNEFGKDVDYIFDQSENE